MTIGTIRSVYLVGLLGLLTSLDAMSIDMYIPALPQIGVTFSVDPAAVDMTLSAFLVGLALGQMLYGPLSDRYGRRAPLLLGLVAYLIGSASAAVAPSIALLVAGRVLQALGASSGLVLARAIVADRFEERHSAAIFSVLMQILGLSAIVAPIAGSWLLGWWGWRSIFVALTAVGAICLGLTLFTLGESLPPECRSRAGVRAQASGALSLAGDRVFVFTSLALGWSLAAMFAFLTGSSFVFIDGFGWTPVGYGELYAATSAGFVAVGLMNTAALRRYRPREIVIVAVALQAAVALGFAAAVAGGFRTASVTALSMLVVIGNLGLIIGNLNAIGMDQARAQAGLGSSLIGIIQFVLSALVTPFAAPGSGSTVDRLAMTVAISASLAFASLVLALRRGSLKAG